MLTLLFVAVLHCVTAAALLKVLDSYDSLTIVLLSHIVWLGSIVLLSRRMGRMAGGIALFGAGLAVIPALFVGFVLWAIIGSGEVAADKSMLATAYQAHDWRVWLSIVVAVYAAWVGAWRRNSRERNRPNPIAAAVLGVVPGLGFAYVGRMGTALMFLFVPLLALLLIVSSLDSVLAARQFAWVAGVIVVGQVLLSVVLSSGMAFTHIRQPNAAEPVVYLCVALGVWAVSIQIHGFLTGKQIVVAEQSHLAADVQRGDWVVIDREASRRGALRTGQLVNAPNGEVLRVVGLPGEAVEWRAERLYVDGVSASVELISDNQVVGTAQAQMFEFLGDGHRRHRVIAGTGSAVWPAGPGYVLLPDDRSALGVGDAKQYLARVPQGEVAGPLTYVLLNMGAKTGAGFDWSRRGVALSPLHARAPDGPALD